MTIIKKAAPSLSEETALQQLNYKTNRAFLQDIFLLFVVNGMIVIGAVCMIPSILCCEVLS